MRRDAEPGVVVALAPFADHGLGLRDSGDERAARHGTERTLKPDSKSPLGEGVQLTGRLWRRRENAYGRYCCWIPVTVSMSVVSQIPESSGS
jgi:hypothetical protein